MHIVDRPDPAAAFAFAFDEPNQQAGEYRDLLRRRWRNLMGRTMWDFPGGRSGGPRCLVLGFGPGSGDAAEHRVPAAWRDELVTYGPLLSDDGAARLVAAALVRAPDGYAARGALAGDRYADVEVPEPSPRRL